MARFVLVVVLILASLALSPALARATTNPVAAYGFEDASATVAGDSSDYGNNGTVQGGATRAAGKFGNAINFDGSNDIVKIPDAGYVNLASNMTLEAWVKPTAVDDYRAIVVKERLNNLSYGLYGSGSYNPAMFVGTS